MKGINWWKNAGTWDDKKCTIFGKWNCYRNWSQTWKYILRPVNFHNRFRLHRVHWQQFEAVVQMRRHIKAELCWRWIPDLWPKRISWAMRRLVYEIASIYKTHKFAQNFKELGIYSCFRMTRNCRLGSSLASQRLENVDKTMPSNCRRSATTYPLPWSSTMDILPRSSCSLQVICFWWYWSINDQRSAANLCIYLQYRSHKVLQQISNVWTSSGCSTYCWVVVVNLSSQHASRRCVMIAIVFHDDLRENSWSQDCLCTWSGPIAIDVLVRPVI